MAAGRSDPWNARPDEDGAAGGRSTRTAVLGRHAGGATVQLDPLDVAGRDLVDLEASGQNAVHIIHGRTVGARDAREAQGLAPVRAWNEGNARDHAHHVAEEIRMPRLDLGARHEV